MSYLVFARKWRPLTFEDVVGQEHITSTLKRAIEKNRVAHAYIFTGTRGVGKTTTARILARALNCDKGPTINPCGECESCKNIINGSSFDVLEIDGASNNGVDSIRELRENVSYTSMGGKYRIFVIDEVHMLTKGAFNALLKTLEEPPKNVIFIFATTEPQRIPDTIHSRCQRYDFRRISTEQIGGQLEKICTKEEIVFEKSGLLLVARKADGSMRDALSLLDQVFSFCKDTINEKEVRSVLGLVETDVYNNVIKAMADKEPLPAIEAVEDILNRGFDLQEFILGFQEYLRTLLFIRLPGIQGNQRLDLSYESAEIKSNQASNFSEGDLLRMIEIIRKAETELKWSSFPRFVVEVALLKMVYMDTTVSVQNILSALKNGSISDNTTLSVMNESLGATKKKTSQSLIETPIIPPKPSVYPKATTPASLPLEETPEAFTPVENHNSSKDLNSLWSSFIEKLTEDRPVLGSFISMANLAEVTENSVDVRFKNSFTFQYAQITKVSNREVINKKLSAFAGRNIELHITIEKKKVEEKREKVESVSQPRVQHLSFEDDMENEPILKNIIKIFDGEVL